jgi:hypothetical protein
LIAAEDALYAYDRGAGIQRKHRDSLRHQRARDTARSNLAA